MGIHHSCEWNCGGTDCDAPKRVKDNFMGEKLKPCPCGKTPTELYIVDGGQGQKYAFAYGSCCGEWHIEFRTDYKPLDSQECMQKAIDAWNLTPRSLQEG